MTVDIEKLEALAKAAQTENDQWFTFMQLNNRAIDGAAANLIFAANPAVVLELIADQKRMASRLLCCTKCGGQGEVYSGRTSYEGYNQPPEPIMDKCGECDGDGALGDAAECISILDEVEQLRAENAGLKTGYEAYGRVNAELRAKCEALKEKYEAARDRKNSITALQAENEALRKDASLHVNLQRAAGELPGAWSIDVSVERHAGWVSLLDGDGCEYELSGEGHLGEQVSEALEVALEMSKESGE